MVKIQDPVVDDNLGGVPQNSADLLSLAKDKLLDKTREVVVGEADSEVDDLAGKLKLDDGLQENFERHLLDKKSDQHLDVLGDSIVGGGLSVTAARSLEYTNTREESESDLYSLSKSAENITGDVLSSPSLEDMSHKEFNDNLRSAKDTLSKFEIEDDGPKKSFREILADSRVDYEGKELSFKNGFAMIANAWENSAREDDNIFSHTFRFFKQLFIEGTKWKTIRDLEDNGSLKKVDEVDDQVNEVKKEVKEGAEMVKKHAEEVGEASDSTKENPAALSLARMNALRKVLNSGMTELLADLNSKKISKKEFSKRVQSLYGAVAKKGAQDPTRFKEFIKKGKMHGFTLRNSGRFAMVEVLNRSIMEAVESGKFWEGFKHSIASSNVWVEAAPVVGTVKSFERFFDKENPDPTWVKSVDLGLNVVGDTILAAGVFFGAVSGGTSVAAGVAARGGVLAYGKSVLKKSAVKVGSKEGVKQIGKSSAKFVGDVVKDSAKLMVIMQLAKEAVTEYLPEEGVIEKQVYDNMLDDETQDTLTILDKAPA